MHSQHREFADRRTPLIHKLQILSCSSPVAASSGLVLTTERMSVVKSVTSKSGKRLLAIMNPLKPYQDQGKLHQTDGAKDI